MRAVLLVGEKYRVGMCIGWVQRGRESVDEEERNRRADDGGIIWKSCAVDGFEVCIVGMQRNNFSVLIKVSTMVNKQWNQN